MVTDWTYNPKASIMDEVENQLSHKFDLLSSLSPSLVQGSAVKLTNINMKHLVGY